MMCCNECPFHPVLGSASQRCPRPLCANMGKKCRDGFCAANLGSRCMLDYYVINRLYQQDSLAESLAGYTLKTALTGRDRALLLSLFHAATDQFRVKLWRWLEIYEPRSLWLLNPVFAAVGLTPLNSFGSMGSSRHKYLEAILANPYGGRMLSTCRASVS